MRSVPRADCEFDAVTAHELLADPTRRATVAALAESAPLSVTELSELVAARDHEEPSARSLAGSRRELETELAVEHLPRLERACVVTETEAGYDRGPTFGSLVSVLDTTDELVGEA
ncbi:DUF7344 domain-containing protein [Halorarius halobius]|uniref:DUF7344 domain-containing protein n=1 Tax=Halorarius halobius TaxID=2962671 RepID=UPI0020CFAA35|nr:hypothetical protein [Halorarius halobius]